MQPRMQYFPHFSDAFAKVAEVNALIAKSTLNETTKHLVNIRASQINGCTFCVDMHIKEAKIHGEKEIRLHHVAVWKESPLFTDKERAALLWTEAVTKLSQHEVSDEVYKHVREFYDEKELTHLTMAVAVINLWNRFAATFHGTPGSLDKMYGLDKAGL